MKKTDVLLGLQWGDEGKGKVVDVLTPKYDVITRFQGGPNAGHTLEFENIKHVLHLIPSGIFHKDKINIIGNGVVLDPCVFKKEIEAIRAIGFEPTSNLFIAKKAHLIIPTHRVLDAASEKSKGDSKIGSTLKGIGPTYTDKVSRNGLRVGDILSPDFKQKYDALVKKHLETLKGYNFEFDLKEFEKGWFEGIEELKKFKIIDNEYVLNEYMTEGKAILAEGAQGTMLDIDFGSYPFVTSSNTISAGACTGLGIAPNRIGEVFGIVKAYATRVGSGPFPTELFDAVGDELRKKGHEFGSTTGRPRRTGWLDIPALKYSLMINGVTQMFMMKADVLSGFDKIQVCVAYKINGKETTQMPFETDAKIEPVYKEFKGWSEDLTKIRKFNDLPDTFKEYISFVEQSTGLPIKIISIGPNRDETIMR